MGNFGDTKHTELCTLQMCEFYDPGNIVDPWTTWRVGGAAPLLHHL